ncbi:hypothetical protein AB7M16_000756 [Bradyrhizobium sp. USDA 372]
MNRFIVFAIISALGSASAALAQVPDEIKVGKFRECPLASACTRDCSQTLECSAKVDTRECRNRNLIVQWNDPVCEATKASQNALYDAQKAACEAQKAQMKAVCEAKKQSCRIDAELCSSLRSAEIASTQDEVGRVQAIFDSARQLPSELFPSERMPAAGNFGFPSGYEVRYSTLESPKFSEMRWGPFTENSLIVLPVQDRLIFKQVASPDFNSPQVWRSLIWLGFLQRLGAEGVVQILKLSPGVLEKSADEQLAKLCSGKC